MFFQHFFNFFFSTLFLVIFPFEAVNTCFLLCSSKFPAVLLKTFFLKNSGNEKAWRPEVEIFSSSWNTVKTRLRIQVWRLNRNRTKWYKVQNDYTVVTFDAPHITVNINFWNLEPVNSKQQIIEVLVNKFSFKLTLEASKKWVTQTLEGRGEGRSIGLPSTFDTTHSIVMIFSTYNKLPLHFQLGETTWCFIWFPWQPELHIKWLNKWPPSWILKFSDFRIFLRSLLHFG